ncbi:Uncharacterised protein [Salmonella enterica subsp. enterica]|nr:Uncharacterised protein [Salmonella enterica subsp. enterica] [Salmonella enterica subsp. enterica serovar Menston]
MLRITKRSVQIHAGISDNVACISNDKGQQGAGLDKYGMVSLTEKQRQAAGDYFRPGSIAQQLRFVGFFPWEVFATEVAVSRSFL